MTEEQLTQRKNMILQLVEEPAYVPMKLKEMAILLDVPKGQREELKEVLDALLSEGKIGISKKRKVRQAGYRLHNRYVQRPSEGLWLCDRRRTGARRLYTRG